MKHYLAYFENYETLRTLLDDSTKYFEIIKEAGENMQNGLTLTSSEELRSTLEKVCGVYSYINSVAALAEHYAKRYDDQYREAKKQKILDMVDPDVIDYYQRTKKIFVGQKEICEKIISVCQSNLKSLDKER